MAGRDDPDRPLVWLAEGIQTPPFSAPARREAGLQEAPEALRRSGIWWSVTMREDKKKRLRAAGWKVGGARDFLGLTDAENALVELRLALADKLRESRVKRHLTQAQVAHGIESSQSRVAKMEAGDPSVSTDLLLRALFWCGVEYGDLAELIDGLEPVQRPTPRPSGTRLT